MLYCVTGKGTRRISWSQTSSKVLPHWQKSGAPTSELLQDFWSIEEGGALFQEQFSRAIWGCLHLLVFFGLWLPTGTQPSASACWPLSVGKAPSQAQAALPDARIPSSLGFSFTAFKERKHRCQGQLSDRVGQPSPLNRHLLSLPQSCPPRQPPFC